MANGSDMHNLFAAGLKNWAAFTKCFICSANIVNKLTLFSCPFAAGEARFDEPRAPTFDNIRCGTHRIRSDRAMRRDDVMWRKLFACRSTAFRAAPPTATKIWL